MDRADLWERDEERLCERFGRVGFEGIGVRVRWFHYVTKPMLLRSYLRRLEIVE